MPNETGQYEAEVAAWIRSLGPKPRAAALPDPDWIWLRARIAAREEAEARALRASTLRRTLLYGIPTALVVWLLLDWAQAIGLGPDAWARADVSLVYVAISALAALAGAVVTGALVFGTPRVASRLRYLGLL
jgi:hypothetical protein